MPTLTTHLYTKTETSTSIRNKLPFRGSPAKNPPFSPRGSDERERGVPQGNRPTGRWNTEVKLVSLSPQALSRQLRAATLLFFFFFFFRLSLSLSSSFSRLYFFFSEQRRSSPGRGDDFQRNRPWNEEERAAAVEFICRRKKGSFESRTARFVRSILITALRPILCAFRRGAHALSPPEQP